MVQRRNDTKEEVIKERDGEGLKERKRLNTKERNK